MDWTKSANALIKELDLALTKAGNVCTECGAGTGTHYTWCTAPMTAPILAEQPVTQDDLDYVKKSLGL